MLLPVVHVGISKNYESTENLMLCIILKEKRRCFEGLCKDANGLFNII